MAARDYILTAESQIAERDAQIAEMRKVTGPKCPKCGHWLKAEHLWFDAAGPFQPGSHNATDIECGEERCGCRISVADLIANHPDIAREMGLAADGGAR